MHHFKGQYSIIAGKFCGVQSAVEGCCMWLIEYVVVLRNIFLIDTLLVRIEVLLYSCVSCNMLDSSPELVGYYIGERKHQASPATNATSSTARMDPPTPTTPLHRTQIDKQKRTSKFSIQTPHSPRSRHLNPWSISRFPNRRAALRVRHGRAAPAHHTTPRLTTCEQQRDDLRRAQQPNRTGR
jgi:hypothetical protein